MKSIGGMRMHIGALLAALSAPLIARDEAQHLGKQALDTMFSPRFDMGGVGGIQRHKLKNRHGGKTSPLPHRTTSFTGSRNHPTAALGSCGQHFENRMAWLERNAHVIAKREADQARAMSAEGGRNRVMWGRR